MNSLPLQQIDLILKAALAEAPTLQATLAGYATALNCALGSRVIYIELYLLADPQPESDSLGPPVAASSTPEASNALKRLLALLAPETADERLQAPSSAASRARNAPLAVEGFSLNSNEAALMHCEHLHGAYAYILIVGPPELATPAARSSSSEFLNTTLQVLADHLTSKAHPLLRNFYSQVLSTAPKVPHLDHVSLCDSWKELFNATSAWLWIFNKHTDQWELLAVSTGDEEAAGVQFFATPQRQCLAEYCNRLERPEFVPDMQTWERQLDGTTYSIVCKQHFANMGYRAVDCVPLLFPELSTEATSNSAPQVPLRGAICAYFKDTSLRHLYSPQSLKLAGKVSALKLVDSYQNEQRALLISLNRLAHHFLTTKSKRPGQLRKEYLKHVIDLCQRRGLARYASIFYQDSSRQGVHCLATTGLWKRDGVKLKDEEIEEASYAKGKGRTGTVFETGEPFIPRLGRQSPQGGSPTYKEIDPTKSADHTTAWIIYPIFSAVETPQETTSTCIGVIRCTSNVSPTGRSGHDRNFDPVQIQTLDFIARQLALPLETLDAHISRERSVNIIKHDLFAPIEMVESSTIMIEDWHSKLKAWLETVRASDPTAVTGEPPQLRDYALKNLGTSILFLKELVQRLDPDPTTIEKTEPVPTLLEGDVIARLKAMLLNFAERANKMQLRFESFADIPPLLVDKFLIERVFTNLIVNAVKYGRSGSTIVVEPRRANDGYRVTVSNQGIGITQEDADLIFKRDYRGKWAKEHKQGSGLGLKISRAIMLRHGGKLELLSRADPTVFEIFFPVSLKTTMPPKQSQH